MPEGLCLCMFPYNIITIFLLARNNATMLLNLAIQENQFRAA
jgi:hypothetical protein